ncbi:hypothetical protein, partial [Poseidonibacter sp.]|uniref:hypothetical protein n=1 Tax=Poseidonibacter sp. TaxID=2321188 RepID=UPI003C75B313
MNKKLNIAVCINENSIEVLVFNIYKKQEIEVVEYKLIQTNKTLFGIEPLVLLKEFLLKYTKNDFYLVVSISNSLKNCDSEFKNIKEYFNTNKINVDDIILDSYAIYLSYKALETKNLNKLDDTNIKLTEIKNSW